MFEWLFLGGRVLLLGYERIVVKELGENSNALAAGFLFFFIGALCFFPFIIPELAILQDYSFLWFAILSGALIGVADYFYIWSFAREKVSVVAPLYNTNLLFLAFLAILFAGDSFTIFKVLGIAVIFLGAFFLQKNNGAKINFLKSKPVLAILLSAFLFSVLRVIDSIAFKSLAPPPIIYATAVYLSASGVILLFMFFKKEVSQIKKLFLEKPRVSIISGAVNGFSYLFLLFAITRIEISVAEPIAMLSLVVAVVLAKIKFKENPNWLAVFTILLGSFIVTLS